MKIIHNLIEEKRFIQILNEAYYIYFKYGSRSPKKVNFFHSKIREMLLPFFPKEKHYDIHLEYNIASCNSSRRKKCDIVVLKQNTPYIIFPVKIIMTNYKQNKNNSWENLTGEVSHIKWYNNQLNIIPINIFMKDTPYLNTDKKIKFFERVTNNDIHVYNILIEQGLCYDVINYIVEVEHSKNINEKFDEILPIQKFHTKYRPLDMVLYNLLE